jgi:hypothetical protein
MPPRGAHIQLIRAIVQPPATPESARYSTIGGSWIHTLRKRLPDFSEDSLNDLVDQLKDLRVLSAGGNLQVMMSNAEDMRPLVIPFGQRFVEFIRKSDAR